ncbi:MAG: hypothetical protein MNPFHGCM_01156 [Gemmatimonadaceae bacterium]|nr:hypothetical protein [Gemmatimonadaceae bacterium]
MPSRRDAGVPVRERALRGAALAALVVMAARILLAPVSVTEVMRASTTDLHPALVRATYRTVPAIELDAARTLTPMERDWLRALSRAETTVRWRPSRSLATLAVQAERSVEPGGGLAITMLAPRAMPIVVGDDDGIIDSLRTGDGALSIAATVTGALHVRTDDVAADVPRRDSLPIRSVVIIGQATWETKFIAAALEESGWPVVVSMRVAPGVVVGPGATIPLDTTHVSAVVVLDSVATRAADVARYVRSGGGAILAMGAVLSPAIASLAGVSPAQRLRGELGALTSSDPVNGLAATTFTIRDSRSSVLDRRGSAPIVVARRSGAGRVLALGVEDTWRWRMAGASGSVEAHRRWWSRTVASVAYAPLTIATEDGGLDAAPTAAMYAALGAPASFVTSPSALPKIVVDWLLVAVILIGLMGEWASRRLRGAR